jgi:hypothetical protein
MYFVRTPEAPQHLTNSFADAVDWCCVRLQEAGVSLNPEIERLR